MTNSADMLTKLLMDRGLIHHQLASFNEFVHKGIKRVVAEENIIKLGQTTLYIESVECVPPTNTPYECRLNDLTYDSGVYVTLRLTHPTRVDTHSRVLLFRLPVMIRSTLCSGRLHQECINDIGGYFIIRSKERVLVVQERNAYNSMIVQISGDVATVDMRSMSTETGHSVAISAFMSLNGTKFLINLPYISNKIPIAILFKALGVVCDDDIKRICALPQALGVSSTLRDKYDRMLSTLCREGLGVKSSEEAIAYIAAHTMHTTDQPLEYVKQVVTSELFPHLGPIKSKHQTVWLISQFVRSLLSGVLGLQSGAFVSKDHLSNKRYDAAGTLLFDLLRTSYKRFVRSFAQTLNKQGASSITTIVALWNKSNPISKDIRYSFLTGSWGMASNSYVRTGVSQVLARLSYIAFISHLRRINVTIGKEIKNVDVRMVHQSSFGFIDPSETPEGACVGIQKNMSLLAYITLDTPKVQVISVLERCSQFSRLESWDTDSWQYLYESSATVCVNNTLVGCTPDPQQLVSELRHLRMSERLESTVSIIYSPVMNAVLIWCDAGRLYRAVIYKQSTPVFLDVTEIEDYVINETSDYSEVHPTAFLGVTCNIIPFADHNQAPRICYYTSQVKQALGTYATNHPLRFDTTSHVLSYPQAPLVSTRLARFLNCDQMACGVNCIVAVCTYTGYNQEDCVIINKSAVDRGLFTSYVYHSLTVDEKKELNVSIQPVDQRHRKTHLNYNKLDPVTGIVKMGMHVETGDVVVSRLMKKKTPRGYIVFDNSVSVPPREQGIIDKINVHVQADGTRIVKIRMRLTRDMELGDKLANVSAQKGTIGLVLNCADMPFTESGIVPDIIINPHSLPSRMTISMLLEMVLGKTCAIEMRYGDATPFTDSSTDIAEQLIQGLEKNGFDGSGLETMYNGMTGEKFATQIFTGITYYHKLKHMVADKCYARSVGGVSLLTKQPQAGRSRQGALRLGELETSTLIAQGTSAMLVDRVYNASDAYVMDVCSSCNSADICNCNAEKTRTRVPYAFRLLQQELFAMGYGMKFKV